MDNHSNEKLCIGKDILLLFYSKFRNKEKTFTNCQIILINRLQLRTNQKEEKDFGWDNIFFHRKEFLGALAKRGSSNSLILPELGGGCGSAGEELSFF